jgi:hypothetical protein
MDAGSADGAGSQPADAGDIDQPVAVLEELLTARGEHLLRTAVLLAGTIRLTGHKSVSETTIWVDPSDYLPARLANQLLVYQVSG